MANRDDDGDQVNDPSLGRNQDIYRFQHGSNTRPLSLEEPSVTPGVRPKRPRPFRPEYEYYSRLPYHRMPGTGMVADYWSPRPTIIPPYALDPTMIPVPPAHYTYPSHSNTSYDYGYDLYGYTPYHTAEYNEHLPTSKIPNVEIIRRFNTAHWRRRPRGTSYASIRGRVEKTQGVQASTKTRSNRNDYNQHFVDTGHRPQNFLRDSELEDQYEDYPNAKRLVTLKARSMPICFMTYI